MTPDFLILGAAKSATTWLARELGRHPRIWLPASEIHYFSLHFDRGGRWYERHFDGASADLVGDHSNTYLYVPEASERLARSLPDAKLLVVLRHPVERAYSGYCMQLRSGRVDLRIERHLDPEVAQASNFLTQGLYHRHLQRFLRRFDRSALHVALFDDLHREPRRVLCEALAFLGIDPGTAESPGPPRNVRRGRAYSAGLQRLVQRFESGFPRLSGVLAQSAMGRAASGLLRRNKMEYPPLTTGLRQRMCEFFASDVERLETLLDRDLSAWRS